MLGIPRSPRAVYATGFASASTDALSSAGVIAWSSQSECPHRQHFQSSRVVARHANRRASEMCDLSRASRPPHRQVNMEAPPLGEGSAPFGPPTSPRFHWNRGRFGSGRIGNAGKRGRPSSSRHDMSLVVTPTRLIERLQALYPDASRRSLKQWLTGSRVRVNGAVVIRGDVEIALEDRVELAAPAPPACPAPLRLVHEDDA